MKVLFIIFFLCSISLAQAQNALFEPNITSEDHAIDRLKKLTQYFKEKKSSQIYFNAIYLKVTEELKNRIYERGYFQNPDCISGMLKEFSNMYLNALKLNQTGKAPAPWDIHFKSHGKPTTKLMLGMSAHISYDLPISIYHISQTPRYHHCKPHTIQSDYFKMDTFFEEITPGLNQELKKVGNYVATIDAGDVLMEPIVQKMVEFFRQGAWNDLINLTETHDLYGHLGVHKLHELIEKRRSAIETMAKTNSTLIDAGNFVLPAAGY